MDRSPQRGRACRAAGLRCVDSFLWINVLEIATYVAWHLIARMRRFGTDLAFDCENLGDRILKLTAFEKKRLSTCELGLPCSRWRQ